MPLLALLHLLFIILKLLHWVLERGFSIYLSLALAILVLEPFCKNTITEHKSNLDNCQATPTPNTMDSEISNMATDKKKSNTAQSRDGPVSAIVNPEMVLSAIDIQRLVQMERRRDARISIVEKGYRHPQ